MKKLFGQLNPFYLLLVPFFIVACGQEKPELSDKNKDAVKVPSVIPTSLNFVAQKPGLALTDEQKKILKETFAQKNMHILPPSELLFPNPNTTDQQLLAQEEILKKKDETSYKLLKNIQSNCLQERPTIHTDATFPANGIKGFENLKINDHIAANFNAGILGKTAGICPVDASIKAGLSAEVQDVDSTNPANGKATGKGNLGANFRIVNKDFQTLFSMRGLAINSNLTGLVIEKDTIGNSLIKMKLSGTYIGVQKKPGTDNKEESTVLVDKKIPFNMSVEFLEKRTQKIENGKVIVDIENESVTTSNISLQTFKLTVDVHEVTKKQKIDNGSLITLKTKKDVFFNGHQSNEDELNQLLNSKNLATSINNNKVLHSLK